MMLEDFIVANREAILTRCRSKVATRSVRIPMEQDSDYGVHRFLNELATSARRVLNSPWSKTPRLARLTFER